MTLDPGFSTWADPSRLSAVRALPKARDLIELVRAPSETRPEEIAVAFSETGEDATPLTRAGLWTAALREARRLLEAGAVPGDRVIVMQPTSAAFLQGFFGALAAGAIPVPVSPPQSLRRRYVEAHDELVRTLAADCDASACIAEGSVLNLLADGLRKARPDIRLISGAPACEPLDERDVPPCDEHATAMLQYTSGSTSRPKGVMLSHRNLIANTDAIGHVLFHPEALKLSWLPLHHDMGLIGSLLTSLYWRVPLVLLPPSAFVRSPASWLRGLSRWGATLTSAPNFAYSLCVRRIELEDMESVRLDHLRAALSGAEPVDPAAVERFEEKFAPLGLRMGVVRPSYGLAESSLAVCVSEPHTRVVANVSADALENEGLVRPPAGTERETTLISVGRSLPGVELRIIDRDGQPVPERRVGEIVVRGPSVMAGYFRRPDETAEALRDGWLHTGDLGYLDGGLLWVSGRRKDLIIRSGRNFHPHDLERLVLRVPDVFPLGAAAFGCDVSGSESAVIVVETALRDPESRTALIRAVRKCVHDVFLFSPDEIRLVPPGWIPRTTSGKVRRHECRRLYLAEPVA
ncbi:MAG TPA: fatty acyl-AMP ligase [Thermoanaerobaculia bacterium]|nr:fatty acyl-AMP ligase [Thermoanaerobaculia bacterium]